MFKIDLEDFDIKKIADSGQCFRIVKTPMDGVYETYRVVSCDKYAYIKVEPFTNVSIVDCPNEDNQFWIYYFDLTTNYERFRNSVDQNDLFLLAATDFGKGIRILKQNPWEMLITYIISQRKSIPSIRTCVEKICTKWGKELTKGVFSFPTPIELKDATIEDFKTIGLGYRAEYVYNALQDVLNGKIDLLSFDLLNDEELFNELIKIRGVGPKVANCVSLFGYYRIAAFPIDVWIKRVSDQFYMGSFPTYLYDGFAGIMQQYIFYFIRNA